MHTIYGIIRRAFSRKSLALQALIFVFLCLCFWGRSPSVADQRLAGTGLSLGCTVGDVTADAAIVWLRGEAESSVSVHYSKESDLRRFASTAPVKITEEIDFTAKISIDGLEPKMTYYYRGAVAGRKAGPICSFVTAPHPDDRVDVKFAFSGDTRESFQPFSIMDAIRAMRPDFFLFLGDTIYADHGGAARSLSQFWAKYAANRKDSPTTRLFAKTSVYVTWDDHEVKDDYHPDNPLAPIGYRAFFDYWPVRPTPEEPYRLYRSFRWGKAVELFILDTRQYRNRRQGTILGREQKQWFFKALSSSSAWFKFVATSVPISGRHKDSWGGFRGEKAEMFDYITRQRIGGVVFLAADVHFAAVRSAGAGSALKEFIVGPLAAPVDTRGWGVGSEFFYNGSFNYGLVRVHAAGNSAYVEIEFRDNNNKLLYKTRLDARR